MAQNHKLQEVPLSVHSAAIATASVEIKTLMVSGRQMTLTVFRQLIDEPLIADDGKLRGLPWGIVNYHPDCVYRGRECYRPHWHVIWQKDGQLRRCVVLQNPEDRVYFYRDEPDKAHDAQWKRITDEIACLPQLFIAV